MANAEYRYIYANVYLYVVSDSYPKIERQVKSKVDILVYMIWFGVVIVVVDVVIVLVVVVVVL